MLKRAHGFISPFMGFNPLLWVVYPLYTLHFVLGGFWVVHPLYIHIYGAFHTRWTMGRSPLLYDVYVDS